MKRHLRTHLPGQINCMMCNQFFDSLEEKEEHMKNRHASRHICETCGVSFKRKSDLNKHMVRHVKHGSIIDQDASPTFFRCTHKGCGKVFFHRAYYQYHLNKHSGEKPYECINCLKTFHSKYIKNEHEKDCVLNIQHKCDVCGSVFKHKSGLHNHKQGEHVRSEKGYSCEVCSNTFKYSSGLLRHKKDKHQCIDASQQTETNERAGTEQVHSIPVATKESKLHTEGVADTQSSNAAVIVVAGMPSEQAGTTPVVGVKQTSGIADASHAEIISTMANPVLEKSAEINIGRVIVVHQMAGDMPEHLEGIHN